MSNSCLYISALVFCCTVVCIATSEPASDKDYIVSSNIKRSAADNVLLSSTLLQFHPFLRKKMLSNDMKSLMKNLKRKKRVVQKGLHKYWHVQRPFNVASTRKAPLVNINDVERPVTKKVDDELAETFFRDNFDSLIGPPSHLFRRQALGPDANPKPPDVIAPAPNAVTEGTVVTPEVLTTCIAVTPAVAAVPAVSAVPAADAASTVPSAQATTPAGCESTMPCHLSETLGEILADVEALAKGNHSTCGGKEGLPCDIAGSWISNTGGVRIDIGVTNDVLNVTLGKTVLLDKYPGFLSDGKWEVTGREPVAKTGLLVITAVDHDDKQIASFIGECKTCGEEETVAGHWLYVRASRDCKDQKRAHQILGDVWIRETLHSMKKARLALIKEGKETTTSTTGTANATDRATSSKPV